VKRLMPVAVDMDGRARLSHARSPAGSVKYLKKLVRIVLLRDRVVSGHGYMP
jgi:hypothetical protein